MFTAVLSFPCIHVSLSVRRVQVPYAAACLAIQTTGRSVSDSISLVAWLRLIYIYIYICIYIYIYTYRCLYYTFHCGLSFPGSIHRYDWSYVMAELQDMTIERRARRATVEFRDELYANNLLPYFMHHASRWRHVLAELQHYTFGYRRNDTQPESWDDECTIGAAFLEHQRVWLGIMTELVLRLTPSLGAAFLDHRKVWLGVMTELQCHPVTPSHDHVTCPHYSVDADAYWRRSD